MTVNRKVVLAQYPEGLPTPDCFRVEEEELALPGEGQVLVANEHLSIDAWITTTLGGGGIHTNVPLGGLVAALGVGRVLESGTGDFAPGDAVFGPLCAQTHMLAPAAMLRKVDDTLVPAQAYLGALGLTTGLTAHIGLVAVGEIQAGDTVVVSAAAGAVGSFACEIARLRGAQVIGIAGGPEKVRYVEQELGAAAGIDYKNEDIGARLTELAPDGVNLFFDNVGGATLDAVLEHIAPRARVVICGAISQYPNTQNAQGPNRYLKLAERNSSMRGFTVDFWADHHDAALAELGQWLRDGDFHVREHVLQGVERFPEALGLLFNGGHIGKLTVQP